MALTKDDLKPLDAVHRAGKFKCPRIFVEHSPKDSKDPQPYHAHIIGDGFDHHGIGRTPAHALLRATAHWEAREHFLSDFSAMSEEVGKDRMD